MWVELCFGEAGEGEGREGCRTRPRRRNPRGQVTINWMKCFPWNELLIAITTDEQPDSHWLREDWGVPDRVPAASSSSMAITIERNTRGNRTRPACGQDAAPHVRALPLSIRTRLSPSAGWVWGDKRTVIKTETHTMGSWIVEKAMKWGGNKRHAGHLFILGFLPKVSPSSFFNLSLWSWVNKKWQWPNSGHLPCSVLMAMFWWASRRLLIV
jgi:hypothetical protein